MANSNVGKCTVLKTPQLRIESANNTTGLTIVYSVSQDLMQPPNTEQVFSKTVKESAPPLDQGFPDFIFSLYPGQ